MDFIAKEYNITSPEKWQSIPYQLIQTSGGSKLLQAYHNELVLALLVAYPEENWDISKFTKKYGVFTNKEVVRAVLNWLGRYLLLFVFTFARKLQLRSDDDWVSVPIVNFHAVGLQHLLQQYKGVNELLNEFFPHVRTEGAPNSKKAQQHLARIVQVCPFVYSNKQKEIFPHVDDVHMEFLHPLIRIGEKQRPMELDIYIPSLNLAFEYQGTIHFISETLRCFVCVLF